MKIFRVLGWVCLLCLAACQQANPMVEINKLIADKNIREAKAKYREYVQSSNSPKIHRNYIEFLYQNKQFHDFRKEVREYLNKHPDDVEIKNLEYDHYADLAESSERTGDYPNAIQYIVQKLLSPDYRDHRRWEGRLGDILRKWYKEAEEQGDINLQKKVLTDMIALGFTNLAESLAPPELKKELFKNQ